MPAAVGVGEGVQRVPGIHPEAVARDEDGAGCAERNVAAAPADDTGADRRGGVVAGARRDLHAGRNAEPFRCLREKRADGLIALEETGHDGFRETAYGQHLL